MIKVSTPAAFTRPADTTTYASGDLVANSTTAGSVSALAVSVASANGKPFTAVRAHLKKSGAVLTLASFRVHLYKTRPTVTNGDNGAWLSTESGYIGSFDLAIDKAFSDGAAGVGVPLVGTVMRILPITTGKTVFALIEARAAYVPISGEIFTLTLEGDAE